MKSKTIIIATAVLFLSAAFPAAMSAQPRIAIRLEFRGRGPSSNSLYVSLGDYYHVSYNDVCALHDAGVSDADIPVILYIYTHSQYSLRQIYSLRLNGATWEQLSNWCGVPLNLDDGRGYAYRSGPPYGNAYGYYRNGPGRFTGDDNGHYRKSFRKNDDHARGED